MRRMRGSFWTAERDRRLQTYEGEGFSASVIAERMGTTRNAVLGRSQRLRGLTVTYDGYIRKQQEVRAEAKEKGREKERRSRGIIERMRADIVKGKSRDAAIVFAVERGATYRAVANALGVTPQRVQQIISGR